MVTTPFASLHDGDTDADLEQAQRDAERLRGDALVERARIIAEALREGERLAESLRDEAAERLADAERTADEWLGEADEERERLLHQAVAVADEVLAEADEVAEGWLREVERERAHLLAEAQQQRLAVAVELHQQRLTTAGDAAEERMAAADEAARVLAEARASAGVLLADATVEAERVLGAAQAHRQQVEADLDALRARLEADRREAVGAGPVAAPEPVGAELVPFPVRARERRRSPVLALRLAAAFATVVVVSIGAIGLLVRDGEDRPDVADAGVEADPLAEAFATARGAPGADELVLRGRGAPRLGAVVAADGEGYLDAGPLPPLASRRTYQLWADVNGSTVSLGLLGPDPGVTRFTLPEGTGRIEVTEEPVPGRLTPSSPVVTATLS